MRHLSLYIQGLPLPIESGKLLSALHFLDHDLTFAHRKCVELLRLAAGIHGK